MSDVVIARNAKGSFGSLLFGRSRSAVLPQCFRVSDWTSRAMSGWLPRQKDLNGEQFGELGRDFCH